MLPPVFTRSLLEIGSRSASNLPNISDQIDEQIDERVTDEYDDTDENPLSSRSGTSRSEKIVRRESKYVKE